MSIWKTDISYVRIFVFLWKLACHFFELKSYRVTCPVSEHLSCMSLKISIQKLLFNPLDDIAVSELFY